VLALSFAIGLIGARHSVVAGPVITVTPSQTLTGRNNFLDACLAITVTPAVGGIAPTISALCKLRGATAVHFGSLPAPFVVQPDGSLKVLSLPRISGGSTVPVTVTLGDGRIAGGLDATFTVPLATIDLEGPYEHPYQSNVAEFNWWFRSGHAFHENHPQALAFTTAAPTFAIEANFSLTNYEESQTRPYVLGNLGTFGATLQVCEPTSSPTTGAVCTNWDGSPGIWNDVHPAAVSAVLHAPKPNGGTTSGLLLLNAQSLFSGLSPATMQLAHTLRVNYSVVQTDDAPGLGSIAVDRQDSWTGTPFNTIVVPKALYQLKVMPYTILYQPPGDASTVSFTAGQAYGAVYTVGTSSENDVSNSSDISQSAKFSMSLAFSILGLSAGDTSGWDTTTKQSFGVVNGTTNAANSSAAFSFTYQSAAGADQIPGPGIVCASVSDCSTTTSPKNEYANEPFWLDTFILLVHPQYALWSLHPADQHYVMYGAVPVTAEITVGELDACARGFKWYGLDACAVDYSDDEIAVGGGQPVVYGGSANTLELTSREARHLLALDPFYGRGQNAILSASRAVQVASPSYGSKIGLPAHPFTATLTNTTANTITGTASEQYASGVTTVASDDPSYGGSGAASIPSGGSTSSPMLGESFGLSFDDLTKNGYETDVKTTFTNSTAVSNQVVTSANVFLNDLDSSGGCKTCHNPLPKQPSAAIYFDRVFGTFMFVDRATPRLRIREQTVCCTSWLHAALAREMHRSRFSDVPKNDPNRAILGLMARAGIMAGTSAKTFAPHAVVRNGELSAALNNVTRRAPAETAAVRLRTYAGSLATRSQLPVNPSLLNSTLRAANLPAHGLAASPGATITREEAAITLYHILSAAP
jgi:hypothetical protein